MLSDIFTIVWKESQEIVHGSSRAGSVARLAFPLALGGIFMPWRLGPAYVAGPAAFLGLLWILPMVAVSLTVDAVAGERERYTLESLLATRLSDDAILFGKMTASVLYGWGMMIAALVLGLVTVNLTHGRGTLLIFSPASAATLAIFSLLTSVLVCGVAVLASVRAATVRQAAQTFGYAFTAVVFGTIFGLQALPAPWEFALRQMLAGERLVRTGVAAGLMLVALNAGILALARRRFQRARLILD